MKTAWTILLAVPVLLLLGGCQSNQVGEVPAAPNASSDPYTIDGPAAPCLDSTTRYRFCPGSNFPYHWWWSITGAGASVVDMGTTQRCYLADVTVGSSPATLTFHQRNPVGVPQVHDVRKHIAPAECGLDN